MQTLPFLVTGATGSTGSKLVAILRQRGHAVRALVHREDARSAALQAQGVSIVVGDLLDFSTVRAALEGVRGAYFVFPIGPGLIEATAYFAQAAKEAGVASVVNMSQVSARREAKSRAARNHWMAERVFDWSGLAVTHVRPTFFAEWFLYYAKNVKEGIVRLPFGTGKHAPIAAADQARLIAAVLENPAPHAGKIYPLYGPKEYTYAEAFALLSDILGRPIQYEQVSGEVYRAGLAERPGAVAENTPMLGQHLTEVAIDHTHGIFAGTDDIIETVTGTPPQGLEDFLRNNRTFFETGSGTRVSAA